MQGVALADKDEGSNKPTIERQALTPLKDVLETVSKQSGKRFVVEARLPANIAIGTLRARDIDDTNLRDVLARNQMTYVTIEDITHVVGEANVRSLPIRLVDGSESDLSDSEWVTYVIDTGDKVAARLVPTLRPLLPAAAHLSAPPDTNQLMIVDRWGNVKRIEAVVKRLRASD